jgi:hypothetical protein
MKRLLVLLLLASVGLEAQTPINENNLPSTSTLSDNDSVRVIKNGQSMKTPAGVVRTITANKISDRSTIGQSILTTAAPTGTWFPRVVNGTITYLDADQFLAAIGAGSATTSIREIDGAPDISFNVLEVPNGSLTDIGLGVARLTFAAGGGGGGTWGSITGTLSDQTDLQAALDAKQTLDADLTIYAGITPSANIQSFLGAADYAAMRTQLGLVIGTNVQAYDLDLDDLADGSLTGSKVGTGINAANITTGTLALARGGMNADVSGYVNGLYGQLSSVTADIDTIGEFSTALGLTGTPSSTTVLRGDGVWSTAPGAITVREEDASPTVSSVTEIRVTNGGLTDNGSGSVSLNLAGGGGGGDFTSTVSSSVDSEIVLFSGTTGKQGKRATQSGILTGTSGVIGVLTDSASLRTRISDTTGTGSLVFSQGPTFTSPVLGIAAASSVTSPIFESNAADPADSGVLRLANGESIAWESSPSGTDMTLGMDASEILSYSGTFSANSIQEGGNAVPNATDNLSFFAATSSAQFNGVISDNAGNGLLVFNDSTTLITPSISGNITFLNGWSYANAAMAALAIDTSELNNTKSVSADSTFTFSAEPLAGAVFGLQLTNTDTSAHTMTIPSSKSDALGGAARTTFVLSPSATVTIKWRHEGSGVYTMWGDPATISELTADPTPDPAADYVMTWDVSAGTHKKVLLNALPTGAGDSISVDGVGVVDPNFDDGGDINFTATGSPATVTAAVKADSVALGTDTTGNYVASLTAGLGLTGTVASEGSTPTLAFDTSAALTGDHTLLADQEKFGLSGLIFEGSTADGIETFFSITNPTSSDKTITFPDSSGTVILSGHTFTGNVSGTIGSAGTTTLTITGNAVNGSNIAMGSDAQGDILYYNGTDYARLAAGTAGYYLKTGGAGANPSWEDSATVTKAFANKDLTDASNTLPAEIMVAASDENTAITAGTAKVTFRMPHAMTVTGVRASLTNAQASGSLLTIDINDSGTSILGTKLTIDNTETTSVTAATAATITDSSLNDDAVITIDIDAIGTSGATGLKVTLLGTR